MAQVEEWLGLRTPRALLLAGQHERSGGWALGDVAILVFIKLADIVVDLVGIAVDPILV